jgi:hypothetical protein
MQKLITSARCASAITWRSRWLPRTLGPVSPPSEVTIGYRLTSLSDREVAIVAQTVHTFLDRKTFRRMLIPEGLERAFALFGAGNTAVLREYPRA